MLLTGSSARGRGARAPGAAQRRLSAPRAGVRIPRKPRPEEPREQARDEEPGHHARQGARHDRGAHARRRLRHRLRPREEPRELPARRPLGQELPRLLHVLRVVAHRLQPPRAHGAGLPQEAHAGRGQQARQLGPLHGRDGGVRGHVRPAGRSPGALAPLLHRGRGAGHRERPQDGVRLEGPQEHPGRGQQAGHAGQAPQGDEGHPLRAGLPRPLRVHAVAHEHGGPEQDEVLPEVRLAARDESEGRPSRSRGRTSRT